MAVYCCGATAVTFGSIRLAAVRLVCSVLSQAHTNVPSGEMQVNQTRCSELELRCLSPPPPPSSLLDFLEPAVLHPAAPFAHPGRAAATVITAV